tara:strand:- start:2762 stop:3949 length:1188 start_codon:yes stop_codon:yes gene_type:complete
LTKGTKIYLITHNIRMEKILIVDDVSKNIQMLGNILSHKKYQIAYAQNGEQALDICNNQRFDLILLDIMMPGLDGYQVCEQLKLNPKTKEIPIIFLTAKADMDSIIKGFDIGGNDYITKPFNATELIARVNTHLLINRQRKKLKEMNNDLEKRITSRTSQLEKANHKLGILDQAKSNFLSIISHEIRTPLNGVIGLTELLNQTKINDDQKEYLSNLKEVSERLVKFSNTALLITTLRIDKYHPEILPVSIHFLMEDSIKQFALNYPESILSINSNLPSEELLVKGDSDLLRTCFLMIIENAHKYAGKDPELSISVIKHDSLLQIIFIDKGPGFSKEANSNLFELFSSGDILHNEGSGLGLAAVKLALDANEAEIDISNPPEGGAKIVISIDYIMG